MKDKKEPSIYEAIRKKFQERQSRNTPSEKLDLPKTVRLLRQEKGLSGIELCKRAGDLNPKTLTAVEKGRIRNPSIKTLLSLARGLGVTVGDLFRQAEIELERHFQLGSPKGSFQIDFPKRGVKVVSFTPFIKDFFCGKLIVGARHVVDETLLKHPLPFFISTLIGRFEIDIEGKKVNLKEGENVFFNGILRHSFYNPLHRESVLLMVTAPSFL